MEAEMQTIVKAEVIETGQQLALLEKPKQKKKLKRRTVLCYSSLRKPVYCKICKLKFRPKYIKTHMATVHGEHFYQCDVCSKIFTRVSNAITHIKNMHTEVPADEVKTFYHAINKKEAPQHLANLLRRQTFIARKRHMTKHGNVKVMPLISIFNCFDCSESFASCGDLFEHCKSHRTSETGQTYRYLVPVAVPLKK